MGVKRLLNYSALHPKRQAWRTTPPRVSLSQSFLLQELILIYSQIFIVYSLLLPEVLLVVVHFNSNARETAVAISRRMYLQQSKVTKSSHIFQQVRRALATMPRFVLKLSADLFGFQMVDIIS